MTLQAGCRAYAPAGCSTPHNGDDSGEGDVLRTSRGMKMVGVLAVGGLVLSAAACGKAPEKTTNSGTGTATKACMVTDTGVIDDKSFNSSAWKGMQDAHSANDKISVQYVQSKAETDYEPNL